MAKLNFFLIIGFLFLLHSSALAQCTVPNLYTRSSASQTYTLTVQSGLTNIQWYLETGTGNTAIAAPQGNAASLIASIDGNYTYTATDAGGCPFKSCCPVTIKTCTGTPYTICQGESYTLTAQTGLTNIQWFRDTGSGYIAIAAPSGTVASIVVNSAGNYVYTAKDASGCNFLLCCPFVLIVNPIPTVTATSNQSVCNGSTTIPVNFSGTVAGTTYAWTNNNTSIGLAASGTGTINAFTATNTTSAVVTATITVTPTANGCVGIPQTFTITVNPSPDFTLTKPSACPGITESIVIGSLVNATTSDLVSVDGGAFGAFPGGGTIAGLSVGSHTISLKNSNSCVTTKSISINAVVPNTCIPLAITKN